MPTRANKYKKGGSPSQTALAMDRDNTGSSPPLSPESQQQQGNAFDTILKKLSNLDVITEDIKSITEDISSIRESISNVTKTAEDALKKAQATETKVINLECDLTCLQNEFTKLKQENKSLKDQMIKTEAQERRNNLILDGCPESEGETKEACMKTLRDVLGNRMHVQNSSKIMIDRCHRLGQPTGRKPRSIIFRVHYYVDREQIWAARKNLKDTNIWLSEDFPVEIRKRREILNPIRKKAVSEDMRAFLTYDRLIIDGKSFTIDTLDELPPNLHPSEIATRRSDSHTGFFTKASPLSNFHPCSFKDDDGVIYSSNEQYFQYQKAIHHGDRVRGREILQTDDPGKCKYLGNQVKITDMKQWEEECMDIMFKGCLYKFSQNPKLCDFLMSTGETVLVEANPKDNLWSVGLHLNDGDVFKPTKWKGKNFLGRVLRRVRDRIKNN